MCEQEGRVTAADVVDHVIPLWEGGKDSDSNLQSLCQTPHHDAKSKAEAAERARGG
jgi:5-methylcytosine-specific restriction protein A